MSKKSVNVLLSVLSLVAGGAFYVLFRADSYIAKAFNGMCSILYLREKLHPHFSDFLNFYFLDFLWGFSLACALIALFDSEIKERATCCSVSLLCGIAWEVLQYEGFVGGTADFLDVIMYLLAALFAFIINIKEKTHEKH
ncbi:MAG: hypothetical protein IJO64_06445 [Clostridia bacterium]|nr:hypothetical protein [Clostridia bacterium]